MLRSIPTQNPFVKLNKRTNTGRAQTGISLLLAANLNSKGLQQIITMDAETDTYTEALAEAV